MQNYDGGVNFAVWGRCLYTTYSGKIGLCYANTLPGDEVWIMRGIQVPFVVRPLDRAGAGCAGEYSLRGDCFPDRIMDAELDERETLMERAIVIT